MVLGLRGLRYVNLPFVGEYVDSEVCVIDDVDNVILYVWFEF